MLSHRPVTRNRVPAPCGSSLKPLSLLTKIRHRLNPERLRLVSVTTARNEADIIEPFVRHTAAHVDHLVVVDHCSHDRTPEILGSLVAEGLPMTVLRCESPVYNQAPLTTLLVRRAVQKHGADWVLPLDADEFLWPLDPDGGDLRRLLCRFDRLLQCRFRTFHPAGGGADDAEANPVLRIRTRFTEESGVDHKILVPRSIARRGGARVGPGNHDFWIGDDRVAPVEVGRHLALAHFPVRTPHQLAVKVAVAEMGKNAMGRRRKGLGIHKSGQFAALLEDPESFLATALRTDRAVTTDPFPYRGGPLRFTPRTNTPTDVASILLRFGDALAKAHGRLADAARGNSDPLVDTRGIKLAPVAAPPARDDTAAQATARKSKKP